MTRHKGMSRKMVLTATDLEQLEHLHVRLKRLHQDMNPATEPTLSLMAGSATLDAARTAIAGEGDWLEESGAHKGLVGADGLVELEAIWTALVRMAATLAIHAPAKRPLFVAAMTVKATLAECSRLGSTWSCSSIDLQQALARARERPPEQIKPMYRWGLEKSGE